MVITSHIHMGYIFSDMAFNLYVNNNRGCEHMEKTIIDLQKANGYPTDGVFKKSITGTTLEELLNEYVDKVDGVLFTQYGSRTLFLSLQFKDETDTEKLNLAIDFIRAEMLATEYKWRTLIPTEHFEYNPIENYSMIESEKNQDIITEKSNNTSTLTAGERTGSGTNESLKSPYDNDNYYNDAKNITSNTENSYTDKNELTGSTSRQDNYTKELKRSGNIGVTTSQQMLTSEREVANFSVVKEIAKTVAGIISRGVYYDL